MQSYLVKLPTEIVLEVFQYLSIKDLLILRASCRGFHHIVHQNETTLALSQIKKSQVPNELLSIFRPVLDREYTLAYVWETDRRYATCRDLADHLTNDIASRMERRPLRRVSPAVRRSRTTAQLQPLDPRIESRLRQLRPHLIRSLYVLFDFLRNMKLATLKCVKDLEGSMPDEDFVTLSQCMNWDQQLLIERYSPELIHETTRVFQMLISVIKTRVDGGPAWSAAVSKTLVMGGLKAVEKCLRAEGPERTQRAFQLAFGETIAGGRLIQAPCLLNTISHLEGPEQDLSLRAAGITRPSSVVGDFISNQSVWTPCAAAVMQRRGIEDPWSGSVRSYIRGFLTANNALEGIRLNLRAWDRQPWP